MNYNFTESVRNALGWAREEAIRLSHDYVGTEHLLLGVLRVEGVARRFDIDEATVKERLEESVRPGRGITPRGELPYTSRAKKVLELAMAESRALEHSTVGTEHLLLGLLREEKGIAAQVLGSVGVALDEARKVARASSPSDGTRGRTAPRDRSRWSKALDVVARNAISQASVLKHEYVGSGHLLLALLADRDLLARLGLHAASVRQRVGRFLRPGEPDSEAYSLAPESGRRGFPISAGAMEALDSAAEAVKRIAAADNQAPAPEDDVLVRAHLVVGLLLQEEGTAAKVLASLGLELDSARAVAAGERRSQETEAETFAIAIDDASESASIYQQIIDQVREGVATGALEPGRRLQTVRSLADHLDIAPGTVARAYAELERLGVVVTEGARGTRIAEPRGQDQPAGARLETLTGLLRPVAVAAFHMGGTAAELRKALDAAMGGIMGDRSAGA